MAERRIVTKVEYDSTGVAQGLAPGKAALSSFGDKAAEVERTSRQSVSNMEREYRRLVGAIDPADKAQQRYARAVDVTTRLVERGRITQEQANETMRKAETFYGAQAAAINNVGDLFDKLGGKSAAVAGKLFAVWASFQAGYEMGEQLRAKLNELSDGGFDRAVQSGLGFTALAERLVGVQDDAGAAADRFRQNLEVLRRLGLDPAGFSAEEAERKITSLQRAMQSRKFVQAEAEALFPKKDDLFHQAEVVREAWKHVERGTEEARLNIAKKGAAIAESLRKVPDAFVPDFLLGMEKVVDGYARAKAAAIDQGQAAKRALSEQAQEAKRRAREIEQAWDRAREEAATAERKAAEELKRLTAQRAKDLAEGIEATNRLAAQRTRAIWLEALGAIEEGVAPIRYALEEVGRIDLAADFARRAAAVSAPTEALRGIELDYLDFLQRIGQGSVAAGEEAFADLSEIIGLTVDDVKARLGELADLAQIGGIRGASISPLEAYRSETAELERLRQVAVDRHLGMEADFEARKLQKTHDFWNEQIGAWGGALDFLADHFGKVFAQLQRAFSTYQQGVSAGQAIGDKTSIGAAAGGVAGGIVGIWVAAYEWFKGKTAKTKAESYGPLAVASTNAGGDWEEHFSQLDVQQRRASHQLQDTIDEFARAIGGAFTSFADLEIQVRRDGKFFHAFVEGVLVGSFTDLQSATEAAILVAFRDAGTTLAGVSDLVRQGFAESVEAGLQGLSLDGLQDYLGQLREISEISWSDGARQFQETVRHFDDLWEALSKLDAASAAASQGMADLAAAEVDAWRSRIRTLTGEKESPEEQLARLRREGELAAAQLKMRIADLRLREIELKQEAEMLRARGQLSGAGARLRQSEVENEANYLKARGILLKGEVDLNNAHIAAIEASLLAIGKLLEELEEISRSFDPGSVKLPRVGGRGAGEASGGLQGVIDDSRRRVADAGKSPLLQSLDEVNRRFNEGIKGVGLHADALDKARRARDAAIKAADGNAEAIRKANQAYERQSLHIRQSQAEIDKANEARRAEIELVRRQHREVAGKAAADYINPPSVFRDERGRADDIRKQWKDLLDAGAVKWRDYKLAMDAVNRALAEHLEFLGKQESATLFGQLGGLLDLAGLEKSADKAALVVELQKLNFVIQLAEAQARYAQLVAEGQLVGKNKDLAERLLGVFAGLDLDKLPRLGPEPKLDDPPAPPKYREPPDTNGGAAGEAAVRRLQDAIKLREKYADSETSFAKRLREISSDFQAIFKAAGRGADNLALFAKAVDSAFGELKKPVRDWLDSLGLSQQSPLTGRQQLDLAGSQLDAVMKRIAGGDLTAYQEFAGAGNKLLELAAQQYGTAGEDYDRLYQRLKGMGAQALALADAAKAEYLRTGKLSTGNVEALPLSSRVIIDHLAVGNKSAQQSATQLSQIKMLSEEQVYALSGMAAEIRSLRESNDSLTRELSMLRNSRAA